MPAPAAMPRTLAIVGWGSRYRAMATSPMWRMLARPWASAASPMPDTSAPEQKSPPAPVSTSDPVVAAGADLAEHGEQLVPHRPVGGVLAFRPVHRDGHDPVGAFDQQRLEAHARTILRRVGFNPYRRFRARPADYVLVVAAVVIALALVVWAFLG